MVSLRIVWGGIKDWISMFFKLFYKQLVLQIWVKGPEHVYQRTFIYRNTRQILYIFLEFKLL